MKRNYCLNIVPIVGLLLCGGPAVLRAQSAPTGDPTLRAESRLVLVDVAVADKKGKFARDLTANNFKLQEDGKEQKITGFSLESASVMPERSKKHYIAMFFDTLTSGQTGQAVVRQEATKFVDGFASPDRYMAVVNYTFDGGARVAQNFTTNGDQVKRALSTVSGKSGPSPVQASIGSSRATPSASTNNTVDAVSYRNMLSALRNVVDSLALIRGRKALVLFSGGASVIGDISPDLAATVEACNKANVALYTLGGSGSFGNVPAGSASGSTAPPKPSTGRPTSNPLTDTNPSAADSINGEQSIPRTLADATGGEYFSSLNDLAGTLGKIAAEQDAYYLLSYTPTTDFVEGTCHELRLKTDRSDLEVRARKSYCTGAAGDPLMGKPVGKDLEARAAGAAPGNIPTRMQAPWFYSEPNVARVKLAIDITPPTMKFQKEKAANGRNVLRGEFDLAGAAYKADGSIAARFSDAVKLDFDTQQQVDAFLKGPYHYENQLEVAPGQYNLRMAVSVGDQGFGKAEVPLKVDPWDGQTLGASGIALSHNAHPAADLVSGLDPSLLEGKRPLIANGTEVVPTGTNQFQVGEPGFFYVEAYEPLLAAVKPGSPMPIVGVRTRVLDRASGQQKTDTGVKVIGSFMKAGSAAVPVMAPLPTATLAAGAYRLEITVMRQTGDPIVRTADFDVK